MRELAYTLVTDGPADRVLLRVADWVWRQHGLVPRGTWFDQRQLRPRAAGFVDLLTRALLAYPCEVLMVHRDAEGQAPELRRREIADALRQARVGGPHVCVIPVRMTEAWFLFDETAIRRAAGNPRGTVSLNLPSLRHAEDLPNPKQVLVSALRKASGFTGRRLTKFHPGEARYRLAEGLGDFSPLRVLPAFQQLEADVRQFLTTKGWQ